jgi:tape measure domain-containing protein
MAIIQYGGIRIDVQANTQGVKALRTDIAALTRLVNESSGPAGKFERDLNRIAKVSEDGAANQELLKKATDASIKRFLAASAATGNYLQALQHVAAVIPAAAGRMKQLEVQFLRQQKATDDAAQAERRLADAEANQARALQYAQGIIDQYSTKEQRRAVIVRQLTADLRAGLITQEHYNRAIEASNRLQVKTADTSRLKDFAGGIAGGLSPIGQLTAGAAGFFIGQKTIDLTKESVAAYMEMEQSLIKLEVVLGDARAARSKFNELRNIAVATNQTSDALLRGAVTMAQFGVSTNQITPVMKQLSEISAGNSERLQSLSIAFGQVAAAGRLTGQETLQFVNAGFSPLAEISRTTGRSMADLRKAMEAGQISVKMVANSFKTATEQGGRFFGMADKMSETTTGKVNKLANEFLKLKEAIGELATIDEVLKPLTESISGLSWWISRMKNDFLALNTTEAMLRTYVRRSLGMDMLSEDLRTIIGETGSKAGPPITPDKESAAADALAARLKEQEAMRSGLFGGLKGLGEALGFDGVKKESNQLKEMLDFAAGAAKGYAMIAEQEAKLRGGIVQGLLEERRQLLAKKEPTDISGAISDLPKAVSMGTREAYELINKTQSTMQAKQLEEQRKQRMAQELTNKILQESKKQNIMGILN